MIKRTIEISRDAAHLVDDRARDLFVQGYESVTPEAKAGLLKLLADPVQFDNETGPLMVNLHRMAASLVKCFQGEAKSLVIPTCREGGDEPDGADATNGRQSSRHAPP